MIFGDLFESVVLDAEKNRKQLVVRGDEKLVSVRSLEVVSHLFCVEIKGDQDRAFKKEDFGERKRKLWRKEKGEG